MTCPDGVILQSRSPKPSTSSYALPASSENTCSLHVSPYRKNAQSKPNRTTQTTQQPAQPNRPTSPATASVTAQTSRTPAGPNPASTKHNRTTLTYSVATPTATRLQHTTHHGAVEPKTHAHRMCRTRDHADHLPVLLCPCS